MLQRLRKLPIEQWLWLTSWRRFAALFLASFFGGTAAVYLLILLVDPYDVFPFSLPIEHQIVSTDQRHLYPQIIRSRRFDSLIIGTSTARLIDPQILSGRFGGRFANLSMDSMRAWEQQEVTNFFIREAGPPKVLIVGLDWVWCDSQADVDRITPRGFPEWLYDANPWNDYWYLLNGVTAGIAARLVGYQFGLVRPPFRYDGFGVFTPPEAAYDPARARQNIWRGEPRSLPANPALPSLPEAERQALSFPALRWLDRILAELPASTKKVLAHMPVHVAAQPWPGTREAAVEAECKQRIVSIARARGATVIDWRIASPLTTNDENYWDHLHYRLPIAQRIAHDLASATLTGQQSSDGAYRLVVR